jgi:glycosyltransferase involved in cell wall biosynthesis
VSANPLRVAQVLAGAQVGGAENFFVRLVGALAEDTDLQQRAFIRDHDERPRRLQRHGVPTQHFRFGGMLDFAGRLHYQRALRAYDPEVVLTWMGRATSATGRGEYRLVSRLGHYYDLKYYRHADYWIGITKGICDYLVRGGMPHLKVLHIPNFADESPVSAIPRESFETPAERPLLLAAGRLHVNKGFDVLLHAMAQRSEPMLWLAGTGPEEQNLKQLAVHLGISDRVRFLGWRDDVTELMRTADLFVCPSRHEGLGSIVLEAWAHECPIIATRSQGPAELIEDQHTGVLTPVDDADALAVAIDTLLATTDLREALRQSARDHYWEHYSRASVVSRYYDVFHAIAAS